jgi:hypothetical protein
MICAGGIRYMHIRICNAPFQWGGINYQANCSKVSNAKKSDITQLTCIQVGIYAGKDKMQSLPRDFCEIKYTRTFGIKSCGANWH